MIVSVAEEMNPTRWNTMEDAHDVREPGSWGAPNSSAAFLSVMDGHGGRLIADYLEDHLASNVTSEWRHAALDVEGRGGGKVVISSPSSATTTRMMSTTTMTTANDDDNDDVIGPRSKRRRHADNVSDGEQSPTKTTATAEDNNGEGDDIKIECRGRRADIARAGVPPHRRAELSGRDSHVGGHDGMLRGDTQLPAPG